VRLSTSGVLAKVAAARRTDPAKLSRLVRGELDWVVMKCLEKDRTRRYETANGLARDVERYLKDEPVEACPPSAGYRLRKFARKHKKPLAVAAAFAVLLLTGLALVTWKWQDERAARREAVAARQETEAKTREILVSEDLASEANAALDFGEALVMGRHWGRAEAAFNRAIELRPKQSLVWLQRGELYGRMGLLDLAAADYARAFERREPETLIPWLTRGLLQLAQGDEAAYRQTCRQALTHFAGITEQFPRDTQARLCSLAPGALPDDATLWPLVANTTAGDAAFLWVRLYFRGTACYRAGRHDEAVRCLRESLAKTNYVARSMNYPVLALALYRLGQTEAALQELENTRRQHDQWVQQTLSTRDKLTPWPYWYDWVEFQHYRREAHLVIEQAPPPDDPRLNVLHGRAYAALGRMDRAAAEYAKAVQAAPNDPAIGSEVFRFHVDAKRWAEADTALAALKRLSPKDPNIHLEAFRAFAASGRWDQAVVEHAAATRLRPSDATILLEPFRFHAEQGDAAKADAAYVAATKDRPNDILFRIQCGNACARFKQWQRARDEYARILEIDLLGNGEVNRSAWLSLAVLQLYLDDGNGYRQSCRRLVERYGDNANPQIKEVLVRMCLLHPDPGVAPARVAALARQCLKELGSPAQSLHIVALAAERAGIHDTDLPALEKALATNDWATQRMVLALIYQRRGEYGRARRTMAQIPSRDRRLDPNDGSAWSWDLNLEAQLWYLQTEAVIQSDRWSSAHGLCQRRQYAAAIKAFDALLKPDHKCAEDWITRAYCHGQLGHGKENHADSAKALALDPDSWKAARGCALLCLQRGDRDGYRACCRNFIERHSASNNRLILNNAAWLSVFDPVAQAEAQRALPLIDKAIAQARTTGAPDRNFLHTRGCVLYRLGRHDDAVTQLTDLINEPGYTATAQDWLFLAMAHQQRGQDEQARKFLDQSIAWMAANPQSEWYQQMALERFRAEAEAVIKGGK
jgi:tetratricopeptide (TPR) repeat protein